MIPFPGIVQDLLTKSLIDDLLVSVFAVCRNKDAIFIGLESIVTPERIVESELPLLACIGLEDGCDWALLG